MMSSPSPRALSGERVGVRGRGDSDVRLPLTLTLSPQAGRGARGYCLVTLPPSILTR